jgi:hypothetical protein
MLTADRRQIGRGVRVRRAIRLSDRLLGLFPEERDVPLPY